MLDRQWLLDYQAAREREDKKYRERVQASNKRFHIIEFVLVGITAIVVIVAALIYIYFV